MNDSSPDVSRSDEVAADDTTPELSAEQDRAAADEGTSPAEQASGARGPVDDAADDGADAARDAWRGQEAGSVQGGDRTEDGEEAPESAEERMRRLEEEGDIAADYLEELLDIGDLDGDIDIDVDGDRASVEISGADQLARLNRPKGELLGALQELARLAVQTRTGNRSRLMLDIGGFRAEHKDGLRSEEHTSELQSRGHLVCRLLLEKKKTQQ